MKTGIEQTRVLPSRGSGRGLALVLFAAFVWLWAPPQLHGQSTAALAGTIRDASGAVVPGASVTIENVDLGVHRRTVSADGGQFFVPFLLPGPYAITAEKEGFQPLLRSGVEVEIGQTARVELVVTVGENRETIEVLAPVSILELDGAASGQVLEQRFVQDLPFSTKNIMGLATLSPGVNGVGYSARGTVMGGGRPSDPRPASEIFSNGNREQSNRYLLDGVENSFRRNGLIVLRPSAEAIREVKVQTGLASAEHGGKPGAIVNVVTNSGSNRWRGSMYEFVGNSSLNARDYFAPPDQVQPAFRQNQFGASLGGPVVRNKLFFFVDYEGLRKQQESVSVNTVPSTRVRQGDFKGTGEIYDPLSIRPSASAPSGYERDPFPGRQIPLSRFDEVSAKLVGAYPLPQRESLPNNHVSYPRQKQSWNQADVRLDAQLGAADTVFGRYSGQRTLTYLPSAFSLVRLPGLPTPIGLGDDDPAGDSEVMAHQAVASWTRVMSPTFLVESRIGFTRFDSNLQQSGVESGSKLGERLGIPNANQGPLSDGIPVIALSGYSGIGQSRAVPTVRIENTFNPRVSLSLARGMHVLKFGFSLIRRQITDFQISNGSGRFAFNSQFTSDPNRQGLTGDPMASFLLGTPAEMEQDFLLAWVGIRVTETGTFLQDDWRISDRLSLNLGIRYETDTPPTEVADRWLNFDVETGVQRIAGLNTDSRVGVKADRNNISPRIGFAYHVRPTTVFRGGYGLFYNTQGNGRVSFRLHRQAPLGPVQVEDIDQFSANPRRIQDGFRQMPLIDIETSAKNPAGEMTSLDPDFRSGYAHQVLLQIQHQLRPLDLVLKAGYAGNLSRQLQNDYNFNQPAPGPGEPSTRRPLRVIAPHVTNVNYGVSDGIGDYHSLQVTAERRFAAGMSLLTAYTWSHSIDDVPNEQGGAANGPVPQDIRNRSAERASSGFDVRHRLVQSAVLESPFGRQARWQLRPRWVNSLMVDWQLNLVFTAQTGLPFTPVLENPVSNAGDSRPDRLKSGLMENPDPARWFDTSLDVEGSAWATPKPFSFGNSGRNVLTGPGRVNLDLAFVRQFKIGERIQLSPRLEFFNLFNTPQFDLPNASVGSGKAGTVTSLAGKMRQIQLNMTLRF